MDSPSSVSSNSLDLMQPLSNFFKNCVDFSNKHEKGALHTSSNLNILTNKLNGFFCEQTYPKYFVEKCML